VPEPNTVVDARGLECPLPIFHARDAMFDLPPGAIVAVLADDPQAPTDFERWCPKNGHALLSVATEGRAFRILIRRGNDAPHE
jgi:tRNA 2-thiouridine synthesizing protein A